MNSYDSSQYLSMSTSDWNTRHAVPVVMSFAMAAFIKSHACSLALQQGTHYIKNVKLCSKDNDASFGTAWAQYILDTNMEMIFVVFF